jgi:DNA ligase-1
MTNALTPVVGEHLEEARLKIVKETPLLIAKASKGNAKYWKARALTDGRRYFIQAEFWQLKADGTESRHQKSVPVEKKPKNVGRSNETTSRDQALSELESLFKRQKDKGYAEEGEDTSQRLLLPMLAQKYRPGRVKFPLYTQPKYDGVRCLHDGKRFWSKKGKLFPTKVTAHLKFNTEGHIVDGELILNERFSFQSTASATKKYSPEMGPHMEYHVFDLVDEKEPFTKRLRTLKALIARRGPKGVEVVTTREATTDDEILQHQEDYLGGRFEGTIIRTPGGLYKVGHRSRELLKHKDFDDAEFKVLGVKEGKGKDAGTARIVLKSPRGHAPDKPTFTARMKGTLAQRKQYYRERAKLIGKQVTVKYQGLTDDGVPRFPVGVVVRDYE